MKRPPVSEGKPDPPICSRTPGPPGLVALLKAWPWSWPSLWATPGRAKAPLGGGSPEHSPGSRLAGSPCRPEASWVPKRSAQPSLPPHTRSPGGAAATEHRRGKQQTAKATDKALEKHEKVCKGGRASEEVVAEERFASWNLLENGCKGQALKRQVSPLHTPFSPPKSLGSSKPLFLERTERARFTVRLNNMVGLL